MQFNLVFLSQQVTDYSLPLSLDQLVITFVLPTWKLESALL